MDRTTEHTEPTEITPSGAPPGSDDAGENIAAVSGSDNSEPAPAVNGRTHHVPVTAAWRAEMDRLQAEYAARRRRHTTAFWRGEQPEPPTDTGTEKRGRGGTITDVRQFRLGF